MKADGLSQRLKQHYRAVVVIAAALVGGATGFLSAGRTESIDGFFYDESLAFAYSSAISKRPQVAVIAVDRDSLASERLKAIPRVFLGPSYAEVLHGLFRAGAKAVGFDLTFSYAANRFPPLHGDYDKPFLAALATYKDRVVIARTTRTNVAEPFAGAVFDPVRDAGKDDPAAVAYADLIASEDGIHRWVYSILASDDGAKLTTLAARLAEIAGAAPNAPPFILAPTAPLESLPTYSLVDVLACIESDPAALRHVFAEKVVLIGSNLFEEDRKRAPDRFLSWQSRNGGDYRADHCRLIMQGPTDPDRRTVPGVHVHAAAVNDLLGGSRVVPVPTLGQALAAALLAAVGAAFALFLPPVVALAGVLVLFAMLFFASAAMLATGHWLAVAVPAISAISAMLGGQIGRFLIVERRRRRVERAFGHYLAPVIVDQLASADDELHLGGEMREVTVMFADLSNFTAATAIMSPTELMGMTNRYFDVIVKAVDEMEGYVDNFIGDAVMALWGAPAKTANHASNAIRCAVAIQQRVPELNATVNTQSFGGFEIKIGISSGPAIVGNVGASRRFSYTALGATVNLAARLETACATLGCNIVVDNATMAAAADQYLFCELDSYLPKGMSAAIAVYTPIAQLEKVTEGQRLAVERYESALALYRDGKSAQAICIWDAVASSDGDQYLAGAARFMTRRAETYRLSHSNNPE